MKFAVSRASVYDDEEKPCEEALQYSYVLTQSRLEHLDDEGWYAEGVNHRTENGFLKRKIAQKGWFVEIESLDQLVDFHKKYGRFIIKEHISGNFTEIRIYDDYVE